MKDNKNTISNVSGENATGNACCCLLSEAYKVVPQNAKYISISIKGEEIPVSMEIKDTYATMDAVLV